MARLAFRRYKLPFRHPVRTAHGLWTEREGLIVRVERENGVAGFGECAPIEWFGTETINEAEDVCRSIRETFDERQLAQVCEKSPCLHFAICSALRAPVGSIESRKALPVVALLPAGRGVLDQVEAKAEAGFRTFKWKVGVADLADELAILDDLIARLPEGSKLRLDANGAWDRRKSERALERCADRPVEFIEQPVSPELKGAEDLLLGLAADYPTPIALDESVVNGRDVERWIGRGWPGFFVVKPALLGEPTSVIAQLEKAKAKVVFSSALETSVGAKAALRLAFTFQGEPHALGFGVWPLFQDSRFDGPYQAPFIRPQDVTAMNEEHLWNALT
ncbi:MAG: o-succinylbenzoate synthase [Nibricoccus sp.]